MTGPLVSATAMAHDAARVRPLRDPVTRQPRAARGELAGLPPVHRSRRP